MSRVAAVWCCSKRISVADFTQPADPIARVPSADGRKISAVELTVAAVLLVQNNNAKVAKSCGSRP
jgi:hypothetical protein